MRPTSLASLMLLGLAACSQPRDRPFSDHAPGLGVADVALANGAPETALHIAQQALATDPRNVAALLRMADAQSALGRSVQAERTLRQALAIAPDDAAVALGLGRLALSSDPAAAAEVLSRLSARDPHNIAALIDLGIARDLLGRHSEAQQSYRLALAIDPSSVAGNVNYGLSLALSGDTQQALGILRPLASSPGASTRIRQDLAVALVLSGNSDEAAAILHATIPLPEVRATVAGYSAMHASATAPVPTSVIVQTLGPASSRAAGPPPAPLALAAAPILAAPIVARRSASTDRLPVIAPVVQTAAANAGHSGGQAAVQLAAVPTEQAARDLWQQFSKRMPDLLNGREPSFSRVDRDGHTFWRVRTAGFPNLAQAGAFCEQVRAKGGGCLVAGA